MTEIKSSYLTGLSLANQYARLGAFKGNAAADFGAMLLFRNSTPLDGFAAPQNQFLAGNLQATSPSATKGWGLRWVAGTQPDGQLELVYGDSALAQQVIALELLAPVPIAQRTMLVHVFFIADPGGSAPNNVTALVYVNGALAAIGSGLSFTPADGTGTFRIGGASINGTTVNAAGIGVSGFGYCGTITGASLAAKLASVQAMVDNTVNQALANGDVGDDALLTNLFSVRRGLSSLQPVWTAQKGALNLNRVGSSSLSVESADPLFSDAPWGIAGGGGGKVSPPIYITSTPFDLPPEGEFYYIVDLESIAGPVQLNLPLATASERVLARYHIKAKGLANTYPITLHLLGGLDYIDGLNADRVLMTDWGGWEVVSDGGIIVTKYYLFVR